MERIKCPKCGHEMNTRSTLIYITCSSCYSKIKREPNILPGVKAE